MFSFVLVALLINISLGGASDHQYALPHPCRAPTTQRLTVTNTWGQVVHETVESTILEHHHTALPITNTIIIPSTTVSTHTITWLMPGSTTTSTSTVEHTRFSPVTKIATHTVIQTKSNPLRATAVDVQSMTLTQTVIETHTTTFTTPRFVETIIPSSTYITSTVTEWKTETTTQPIIVTWTNFRTYEVFATKTIFKDHPEPKTTSVTVTSTDVRVAIRCQPEKQARYYGRGY